MKTADELKERDASALTAEAHGEDRPVLRSLVDEIMIEMPRLSDAEARKALQRAAREFCERTNAWWIDAVPHDPWPGEFRPALPPGAIALRVREVAFGDLNRGIVHPMGEFVRWTGIPGPSPVFFFTNFPEAFRSHRMRCAALGFPEPFPRLRLVLAPAIGGDDVPEELLAKWGFGIACGARAHLAALPNRGWSDPAGAGIYAQKFAAAMAEARGAFEFDGVPDHMQARSPIPFV